MAVISALGSIMNLSSELPVSFGNVIDVCVCVYFSISNKYTKYFYYYESNDSVMTISMVKPILFWNFCCSHWKHNLTKS